MSGSRAPDGPVENVRDLSKSLLMTLGRSGDRLGATSAMLDELTAEKTLPQNLEAERSVLGAILLDPVSISLVVPILKQDDFFPDTHRRIFGAMMELSQRSAEIDVLTLKEELDRNGAVDKIGGASYLTSLLDGVPDVGNVEHYARIVKEKSTLRRLIRTGQRIMRDGLAGTRDAEALLGEATSEIFDIAEGAVQGGFESIGEVVTRNLEIIEDARGPAGDAVGPRDGFYRARPDDVGAAEHRPDHPRRAPLGRQDVVRAEHRAARRHPRGTRGRLLLARNVQGAARVPRAVLRGRRGRQEGPRRLRFEGSHAAPRARAVEDPWRPLLHRRQRGPERPRDAREGAALEARARARPADRGLHAADGRARRASTTARRKCP